MLAAAGSVWMAAAADLGVECMGAADLCVVCVGADCGEAMVESVAMQMSVCLQVQDER